VLLGYDLDSPQPAAGQRFSIRLWWRAETRFTTDYTAFVHLVGAARPDGGTVWAQRDVRPCDSSFPTPRWQPGEVIWDDYVLNIPRALPPGTYHLRAGLYDLATGQRLPVTSATSPIVDSAVELAVFTVPE
jgi:hypothetical protein